ncbi:NlpC/P60 family protein [Amphibacillus jilinensis]|uniref:C40 family peptidase n=1 Tax=Amphibacillus jilinensis TaxID=1216008 RepID=UPI000301A4C3
MFKKIILVSAAFLSFLSITTKADRLETYEQELAVIKEQVENASDRKEIITIKRQETDLTKIIRAYRIANTLDNQSDQLNNETYSFNSDDDVPTVVTVGEQWIGNSTYGFGAGRNEFDIAQGLFDCSSFVHWAFKQVGIRLGDRTSVTTDTLKTLGTSVSPDDVQPGDLVFFDTYKIDGHVGIYAGDGKFIGSQSSTGVAYEDMTTGYWLERFNGRVRRID